MCRIIAWKLLFHSSVVELNAQKQVVHSQKYSMISLDYIIMLYWISSGSSTNRLTQPLWYRHTNCWTLSETLPSIFRAETRNLEQRCWAYRDALGIGCWPPANCKLRQTYRSQSLMHDHGKQRKERKDTQQKQQM